MTRFAAIWKIQNDSFQGHQNLFNLLKQTKQTVFNFDHAFISRYPHLWRYFYGSKIQNMLS